MTLGLLQPERICDVGQWEGLVDHRLYAVDFAGGNHVQLVRARANGDATDTGVLLEQFSGRHFSADTGEHTDHGNMPAHADRPHRLGHGARAAHLDDDVYPVTSGHFQDLVAPGRRVLVVDGVVGAQRLQSFQLFIAGGSSVYLAACRLGELQGKDGNTTAALYQHAVPGLYLGLYHQRAPGGQRRTGQGGRFCKTVAGGHAGEAFLGVGNELRGVAINLPAPLTKAAGTRRLFRISKQLGETGALRGQYGEVLQGLYRQAGDSAQNFDLSVRIGPGAPPKLQQGRWLIRGGIDQLDLAALAIGGTGSGAVPNLSKLDVDVAVEHLALAGAQF